MGNRYYNAIILIGIILISACQQKIEAEFTTPEAVPQEQIAEFDPVKHDWPFQVSGIVPDSSVKYGRLDNGLRFAILSLPTKYGDVKIQAQFDVGYLHEPEDKYGIAHLLEHMMFRSGNGKSYDVVHSLQAQGAAYGTDLNAVTGFKQTRYWISHTDDAARKTDLSLKTFAKMLFEPEMTQIGLDRERQIVIAELEKRDNVNTRAFHSSQAFVYPEEPRRAIDGTGTRESLDGISLSDLEQFRNAHYDPASMFLTIVGDIDPQETYGRIVKYFAGYPAATENDNEQSLSHAIPAADAVNFFEDGYVSQLKAVTTIPAIGSSDTRKIRRQKMIDQLVIDVLRRRLNERVKSSEVLTHGNVSMFRGATNDTIIFGVRASDHAEGMVLVEIERLRLLRHGLLETEMKYAIEQQRASFEKQANVTGRRRIIPYSAELIESYNNGRAYINPQQDLEMFNEAVSELTQQDFEVAIKRLLDGSDYRYWFGSPYEMSSVIPSVRTAVDAINPDAIEAPSYENTETIDLKVSGSTAKVVSRKSDESQKSVTLQYSNNMTLRYHQTNYNDIAISVRIRGNKDLLEDNYAAVSLWGRFLSRATIKDMTKEAMDRAFVGQKANFRSGFDGMNLVLSDRTNTEDLETSLKMMAVFIQAFDPKSDALKSFPIRDNSPLAAGVVKIGFLYSDGHQTQRSIFQSKSRHQRSQAAKTIQDLLKSGEIQVAVAGNFNPQELENAIENTLAKLTAREPGPRPQNQVFEDVKPRSRGAMNILHSGEKTQMATFFCWPFETIKPEDVLKPQLATAVIKNRISDYVRVELGLTYSYTFYHSTSEHFPNFHHACFGIQSNIEQEDKVRTALQELTAGFKNKLTKAEFKRALEPAITQTKRSTGANFWLANLMSNRKFDPEEWALETGRLDLLENVSRGDVERFVQANFIPERYHVFRVISNKSPASFERKVLKIDAEFGAPEAQMKYAKMLRGSDDTTEKSEALDWYEKAAAQGHHEAHLFLGKHYRETKPEKALSHLKAIPETGEILYLKGRIYQSHRSIFSSVSDSEIYDLHKQAAKRGYSEAQLALVEAYKSGSFVKADKKEALKWTIINLKTQYGAMVDLEGDDIDVYLTEFSEEERALAMKAVEQWFKDNQDTVWSSDK